MSITVSVLNIFYFHKVSLNVEFTITYGGNNISLGCTSPYGLLACSWAYLMTPAVSSLPNVADEVSTISATKTCLSHCHWFSATILLLGIMEMILMYTVICILPLCIGTNRRNIPV